VHASDDARQQEIAERLRGVRARITAACASAGRAPSEVTLVAVTKTWPASDVIHLASLGVSDIGENRDQEAAPKAAEVAGAGVVVRWHFVGQLQRNKCRSVVAYADLVHSVDSVHLAEALADAAQRHREHQLDVLVQVSLDGDPDRGGAVAAGTGSSAVAQWSGAAGASPTAPTTPVSTIPAAVDPDRDLDRVLAAVVRTDALALRGLMTVAPLGWEPAAAYAAFASIAAIVRATYPSARILSAGMSNDFETAIGYGATHVRVGTALLGNRPPLL
jgi:PLP dependent protein